MRTPRECRATDTGGHQRTPDASLKLVQLTVGGLERRRWQHRCATQWLEKGRVLEKGHRSGQLLISISAEPRRYLPDAHRGSILRSKGKGQSHANMFKRDLAEDTEGDRTHMTDRATHNQKRQIWGVPRRNFRVSTGTPSGNEQKSLLYSEHGKCHSHAHARALRLACEGRPNS